MTIEEHIKKAMAKCPLTEEQEEALLTGLENHLDEIDQIKICSTNTCKTESDNDNFVPCQVTSCCKIGPITEKENYCPGCGRRIIKN